MRSAATKLITFDANNTLFQLRHNPSIIYSQAITNINKNIILTSKEENIIDASYRDVYKEHYFKYPNFGYGQFSSKQFWHNIISHCFHDLHRIKKEVGIQSITDYLYEDFKSDKHWQVYEETHEVLSNLRNHGIKMCVISNFDERLDNILTCLKLKTYFDFVVCSYTFGVAKPHSQIFLEALSQANVPAHQSLHVGDNLMLDYKAALKCGMQARLMNRSKLTIREVKETDQYTSLTDILKDVINFQ